MSAGAVDPHSVHPACVVCGATNDHGLRLRFTRDGGGGVQAELPCDRWVEGYVRRVHGGIIASALDGAMTHCLFTLGRTAVTAELVVKYKHPVVTGRRATVRARLERDLAPLYLLQAELVQDGIVKATAAAKFMEEDV